LKKIENIANLYLDNMNAINKHNLHTPASKYLRFQNIISHALIFPQYFILN